MKLKSGFLLIVIFADLCFFTGCVSFTAHPAGVEPSAKYMASEHYEVLGEAEGISSGFMLFWVFPVTPAADSNEAVDDAIKSKGGDNLIEAVFTGERKIYIIGTVNNIYVKGKVIRYTQYK
jgi:hypothetical protein